DRTHPARCRAFIDGSVRSISMKKISLTRALFVAGLFAVAGGMAQADAIFYPDGTHVELGENGVENGLANPVLASNGVDTTALGAGPADLAPTTTATIITTTPVYVFPNTNFDFGRGVVTTHPHRVARVVTPANVAVATVTPPV